MSGRCRQHSARVRCRMQFALTCADLPSSGSPSALHGHPHRPTSANPGTLTSQQSYSHSTMKLPQPPTRRQRATALGLPLLLLLLLLLAAAAPAAANPPKQFRASMTGKKMPKVARPPNSPLTPQPPPRSPSISCQAKRKPSTLSPSANCVSGTVPNQNLKMPSMGRRPVHTWSCFINVTVQLLALLLHQRWELT